MTNSFVANLLSENAAQKEQLSTLRGQLAWLESRVKELEHVTAVTDTAAAAETLLLHALPSNVVHLDEPMDTAAGLSTTTVDHDVMKDAHGQATLAERIIQQILTTEKGLTLRQTIGEQLGAPYDTDESGESDPTAAPEAPWPPKPLARKLVNLYLDWTLAFYPLARRSEVLADLEDLYAVAAPDVPTVDIFSPPDFRVFRLLIILAGGVTIAETQRACPRSETPSSLCHQAYRHFPAVFRGDAETCIAGMGLYANYCLLDFGRMSPHHVIGVVARFAMELGFHKEDPSLPVDKQDERRRLFYSIYNLDRVVAVTNSKPLAIPDDIITVQLPNKVDAISPIHRHVDPTSFFYHGVAYRRLCGRILEQVYLFPTKDPTEAEQVLSNLHNHLDKWFRAAPMNEEGGTAVLFELYHNILLTSLYRPSPLFNSTHPMRMSGLRRSAWKSVKLYRKLQQDNELMENWVHFSNIVTVSTTLIYTLLEAEGDDRNLQLSSWRRDARDQVDFCEQLIGGFCAFWPGVTRFAEAFHLLAEGVRAKVGSADTFEQDLWVTPQVASAGVPSTSAMAAAAPHILAIQASESTSASGSGTFAGPSPQFSDQALWDSWTVPDLVTDEQVAQMASVQGMGLDALFASVGLNLFPDGTYHPLP
ncbi:hypothetical protein Q8F55_001618 [Vanrija albida]|uniref:Xylanolytic transcriptional activator regulatory domain-containing protein n=1 Tax=Vanrija albida TaxID=181172 RepID=A0ABR3QGJ7_9TREE